MGGNGRYVLGGMEEAMGEKNLKRQFGPSQRGPRILKIRRKQCGVLGIELDMLSTCQVLDNFSTEMQQTPRWKALVSWCLESSGTACRQDALVTHETEKYSREME